MFIDTLTYNGVQWDFQNDAISDKAGANIVFIFGDTDVFKDPIHFQELKGIYPQAHIFGASSSGNILGDEVSQSSLIATAVMFEGIEVVLKSIDFKGEEDLEELSHTLASQLPKEGLKHVFLLSDGLTINGSALVRGINKALKGISVSGGMAGDGGRFQETWIIADDVPKQRCVAVLGFYGEHARISSGCFAGWSEFGTERLITKSKDNVLYELDGEPALDLYKRYLGEYAQDLPSSGLRFPLSIKAKQGDPEVIRTLLAISEEDKSIVFAGDVPEGYFARLMKPDIDILINGAEVAAEEIDQSPKGEGLALIVSCVGRKIVMGQIVDEELEAVQQTLGNGVQLTGFYSYGEIAPFKNDVFTCELHNQTMTLTAIYES